jgi:hypothetical protein
MWQLLSRLRKRNSPAVRTASPQAPRRARLEVEALEGRLVLSGMSMLQPVTAIPSANQPSNALLGSALGTSGNLAIAANLSKVLGTPDEVYVSHLYHDLFHTTASDQVILDQGTALTQHQAMRIDVVRGFTFSQNYGMVVVQDLFQSMLHRAYNPQTDSALANPYLADLANEGAHAPWHPMGSTVTNHHTREDLAAQIAATPEYFQTRGGGTFDGWLNALFADALHRAPTQAERTRFASAGQSLNTAQTVFGGQEHQQVALNDFYLQYLHRPLDLGGQTYWMGRYQAGVWTEEILAEMLSSDEYYAITQQ